MKLMQYLKIYAMEQRYYSVRGPDLVLVPRFVVFYQLHTLFSVYIPHFGDKINDMIR